MVHHSERKLLVLRISVRGERRHALARRLRRRWKVRCDGVQSRECNVVHRTLDGRNTDRSVRCERRSADTECLRSIDGRRSGNQTAMRKFPTKQEKAMSQTIRGLILAIMIPTL